MLLENDDELHASLIEIPYFVPRLFAVWQTARIIEPKFHLRVAQVSNRRRSGSSGGLYSTLYLLMQR